jgi:hypothetical protein
LVSSSGKNEEGKKQQRIQVNLENRTTEPDIIQSEKARVSSRGFFIWVHTPAIVVFHALLNGWKAEIAKYRNFV